jgi:hypothetical protein
MFPARPTRRLMESLCQHTNASGVWLAKSSEGRSAWDGSKAHRILHLDANLRYTNPTRQELIHAVDAAAWSVRRFGPGFVTEETLRAGLFRFWEETGPYDMVVASEHVAYPIDKWTSASRRMFQRNYRYSFPQGHLAYLPQMAQDLQRMPTIKIATLLETDLYRMHNSWLEALASRFDAFVGFGSQFALALAQLPGWQDEQFAVMATDVWANFVSRNAHRVISLPHFVGESEFQVPTVNHSFDLAVPGILYVDREIVRQSAISKGLRVAPQVPAALRRLAGLAGMSGFRWASGKAVSSQQRLFREAISSSLATFTCGSRLKWPLRKFFEIPALGSVLLCAPFSGARQAGFIEGRHFVAADAGNIDDVIDHLRRDASQLNSIRSCARELVRTRHSTTARGLQLACAFSELARGRFRGAEWHEGEFLVQIDS